MAEFTVKNLEPGVNLYIARKNIGNASFGPSYKVTIALFERMFLDGMASTIYDLIHSGEISRNNFVKKDFYWFIDKKMASKFDKYDPSFRDLILSGYQVSGSAITDARNFYRKLVNSDFENTEGFFEKVFCGSVKPARASDALELILTNKPIDSN